MQLKFCSLAGVAVALLASAIVRPAAAQTTTSATFGSVITLGGTPSDIVLDESRGYLYLVQSSANRVAVYDYNAQAVINTIAVGKNPLAAAMSMDSSVLYVTNNGSSSLSVIDLGSQTVAQTVILPANPEGVEVGSDGRAVIATQGNGTSNLNNTLLIFDRKQQLAQQILPVQFGPPPSTPPGIPVPQARPVTTFLGKLQRTPDGNLIVGVSQTSPTSTVLYEYEPSSGTVLQSRVVTGQSSVLSMSPDGSRFMAGFTLYDTASLAVIAQQNTANAPFPITGAFNTLQNIGGSTFSPDGSTVYSAFNVAAFVQPAARPQSSTLLISNTQNLGIQLGIKLPESIVAKMVITSDGANAWGLSESGLIYLPLSTLYNYPIVMPDATTVFLANDNCNRGVATASVNINNLGQGTLTFSVPDTGAALLARAVSGMAPSSITFTMDPGRNNVTRQPGTNLYTGSATNTGTAIAVNIQAPSAINIPPTIRVFMNYRQPDQRGVVYPIPTVPNSTAQGLQDIVYDSNRNRIYIANAGYNRVEVFDAGTQTLLPPIQVGQLPHQMALSLDGSTLYVGNTGGESISMVDLDSEKVVGGVQFPPYPRAGNSNPIFVNALAIGYSGLQFIMSNGTQWEVIGNEAVLRPPDSVAINPSNTSGSNVLPTPVSMIATPGGENILTMNGSGTVYLYDALNDAYTASRQLFNAPITGYYGPLAAAAAGSFYLVNGVVLNSAITQNILDAGQRNVAAVAAVDNNNFIRMTTPVRTSITATPRDDLRTLLEMFSIQAGGESLVGPLAENPQFEIFGTSRVNLAPRQMVVDSNGNVYAITLSGLTTVPLPQGGTSPKPQINTTQGVVNSTDGTAKIQPGSFITVNGTNLASTAVAAALPPPTVLGGACVVFNDLAIPLLQTSGGQISAQIPTDMRPGVNVVQVRSLSTAQQSDPILVTVQKP